MQESTLYNIYVHACKIVLGEQSSKCRRYGNAILTASDHAELHALKTDRLMLWIKGANLYN